MIELSDGRVRIMVGESRVVVLMVGEVLIVVLGEVELLVSKFVSRLGMESGGDLESKLGEKEEFGEETLLGEVALVVSEFL